MLTITVFCELRMRKDTEEHTHRCESCLFGRILLKLLPFLHILSRKLYLVLFFHISKIIFLSFNFSLLRPLFFPHKFSLFLMPVLTQTFTLTDKFRGMSGMSQFLQHHVVVTHMTATPEPEECECFSRANGCLDGGTEWLMKKQDHVDPFLKGSVLNLKVNSKVAPQQGKSSFSQPQTTTTSWKF